MNILNHIIFLFIGPKFLQFLGFELLGCFGPTGMAVGRDLKGRKNNVVAL